MRLQDGTELQAELVIQALGYDNNHAYLSPSLYCSLDVRDDGVHLYRNVLAPQVPVNQTRIVPADITAENL